MQASIPSNAIAEEVTCCNLAFAGNTGASVASEVDQKHPQKLSMGKRCSRPFGKPVLFVLLIPLPTQQHC